MHAAARDMTQQAPADRLPITTAAPGHRRWLLFIHQLPSHPSNLRVTTWRRLQQIGAIPLKQAVSALPDTPDAREDFEWLKTEVKAAGGDASVFAADNLDAWSDDALIEEFRRARQDLYEELARDVEQALKRAASARRPKGTRAPALRRLLDIFRERLVAAEKIDFFGSAGRDRVLTFLRQLEDRIGGTGRQPASSGAGNHSARTASFQGRLWITRPRPGVDRMASAWLIRLFIDRQARFGFAADRESVPDQAYRSTCSGWSSATRVTDAPSKRCAPSSASLDRRSRGSRRSSMTWISRTAALARRSAARSAP